MSLDKDASAVGRKAAEDRPRIDPNRRDGRLVLAVAGRWVLAERAAADRAVAGVTSAAGSGDRAVIDLTEVAALDTAGALLIDRLRRHLGGGAAVEISGAARYRALLDRVAERPASDAMAPPVPRRSIPDRLEHLGRGAVGTGREIVALIDFLGRVAVALGRSVAMPWRFRLTAMVAHMQRTGLSALPIVGLLSFLIGVVLAYLAAGQLRQFGAEIFVVDLLGVAVLRELGVVLTAILLAGRSGSAFTAEIGLMQVNREVDAMRTMGLDPLDVLVMPRLLGLVITLPFVTFFANMAALLGGGLVSIVALDITAAQFLERLNLAITPSVFFIGLIKAPVFAFAIALVACFQGLRVSGSAESVGRLTTRSVVQGIFLVIVLDAAFAILFDAMGI